MNLNKQGVLGVLAVFTVMSLVFFCVCYCSPISYRDDIIEVTTTPKMYRDRFTLKVQDKNKTEVPAGNDSSVVRGSGDERHRFTFRGRNREFENDNFYSKVKSVMPGEKTLRQSDDDDDDYDDGGEYEGFDYNGEEKAERSKKPQACGRPEVQAAAMPMMIIRQVDMVAMQIPMKNSKSAPQPQTKEWSEWSPCSRPCRGGKGLQSRWRAQHGGVLEKEQQFRPCYLADCASRDFQFRPSFP